MTFAAINQGTIDYQVYDYDGASAGDLPFRWRVDYGTLYLDYGYDFALREVRGVRASGRYMRGDLYLWQVFRIY